MDEGHSSSMYGCFNTQPQLCLQQPLLFLVEILATQVLLYSTGIKPSWFLSYQTHYHCTQPQLQYWCSYEFSLHATQKEGSLRLCQKVNYWPCQPFLLYSKLLWCNSLSNSFSWIRMGCHSPFFACSCASQLICFTAISPLLWDSLFHLWIWHLQPQSKASVALAWLTCCLCTRGVECRDNRMLLCVNFHWSLWHYVFSWGLRCNFAWKWNSRSVRCGSVFYQFY